MIYPVVQQYPHNVFNINIKTLEDRDHSYLIIYKYKFYLNNIDFIPYSKVLYAYYWKNDNDNNYNVGPRQECMV